MFTQIIIIVAVILMFVAMFLEIAHPSIVAFITLIFFFVLGFITPNEIMSTVSNEGVLTLALLFIIASVIDRTNVIERIIFYILDQSKSGKGALLRLTGPLLVFSSFLNNTPIVVMMVPAIQNWCQKRGAFASKFLLPISYITIFGGMLTLIGTSTNLIVHGWLLERGFEGFTFFHLFPYAIFGVIIGILYLYFVGYRMLPENDTAIDIRYDEGKKFLYEAVVKEGCNLIGKTVTSQEFKRLEDFYLLKIIREEETISPVGLDDKIQADDVLVFTGTLKSIESLEVIDHLSIKTGADLSVDSLQAGTAKLIEGVVSHNSTLIHHQIKDSNFRGKYDASIVAVHRKNENIDMNIGDIRLKPGDVLLMLAGEDFESYAYENDDFYVLTGIPKKKPMNRRQTTVSISGFALMILLVATGVLSMFESALLFIGLFLLFDFFDFDQVKKSVPFQVLLLVVSSLGVGKVIETSGTAELVSNSIIHLVSSQFGMIGLLVSVYLITSLLTEVVTNAAAAVIVLPIALEVSAYLEIAPNLMAVIVAIAASASFATPIGYQTNLIVYGPGGYKFSDYLKLGLPLNIIFMVTVVFSVYMFV